MPVRPGAGRPWCRRAARWLALAAAAALAPARPRAAASAALPAAPTPRPLRAQRRGLLLGWSAASAAGTAAASSARAEGGRMRQVILRQYGDLSDPSLARVEDAPEPSLAEDEVLVRVRAVGLNPIDFKIAAGNLGGVAPLPIFPGTDCSGVVERVGSRVSSLQVGDEVFGNGFGFLADLAAVKADRLAPKPKSWSFERAAALPTVGLTTSVVLAASPGLAGKSVVVVGASGGVGTLALQAARAAGAARIICGVFGPQRRLRSRAGRGRGAGLHAR
ncbi:unnamed protein product [Prorocentrum cordatum]|uniref:Enoyl reductase (ER) domain-containing protein n=1 Tax=Prorocentrum cordatum TaxID=2364126 RepID=A0ABN9S8L6_9DINO|nr:unnamed protein product [Polarella glacialis]